MPVVCDFVMIQGDGAVNIGDSANRSGWKKTFNTGGRHGGGAAFLMLNVQNLTATQQSVQVKVNDREVGRIMPYYPSGNFGDRNREAAHWYTQMINIGPNVLNSGNNTIEIEPVSWQDATSGDLYDDFKVKDVICFFQQNA